MNFLREAVWVMVKRGTPFRHRMRILSLLLEGLTMAILIVAIVSVVILFYVATIRWALQFFA